MVQRIRSFLLQDAPNWAMWTIGGTLGGLTGLIVFASVAAADQHNDQRYVIRDKYERDQASEALAWVNHIEKDDLKTKPVLEKVEELHKQVELINQQLSHNSILTERNNSILERLDKR
jgi:hypothetical protein